VQVEDVMNQQILDTKEDEDEDQEAGPSVGKKNTREKPSIVTIVRK
jgi:hypothetical protein